MKINFQEYPSAIRDPAESGFPVRGRTVTKAVLILTKDIGNHAQDNIISVARNNQGESLKERSPVREAILSLVFPMLSRRFVSWKRSEGDTIEYDSFLYKYYFNSICNNLGASFITIQQSGTVVQGWSHSSGFISDRKLVPPVLKE